MNSDFSFLANAFRQMADELYHDFDLSKSSRAVWAVKPEAALWYSKKHGANVSLTICRKLSLALGGLRGNGRHPIERELVENAATEILELAEWFDAKALEAENPQSGIEPTLFNKRETDPKNVDEGPVDPKRWQTLCGEVIETKLPPTAFKLLVAVWNGRNRKASFDNIADVVFDGEEVEPQRIMDHQKPVRKFLKGQGYEMQTDSKLRMCWIEKIQSPVKIQ